MVTLFQRTLANHRPLGAALQEVAGLGAHQSAQLCARLGLSSHLPLGQVTPWELAQLQEWVLQEYEVLEELRQSRRRAIQRLQRLGTYRGLRHHRGLPLRGQRTHGNGRTARRLSRVA